MTAEDGLRVLAAGSLRPAFDVLGAAAPGTLRFAYANARDLARRIEAGEPADVFASASAEHPAALHAAGLVSAPRPFASNVLVAAVPVASPARDFAVLAAPGTRVVIEVEGIPLGDYTRAALARLDELHGGEFAARVYDNVVAQEQTVDHVAALLLGGEADAAVLYATDVAARPDGLRAIALPAAAAVEVTCVACTVAAAARPDAAKAWVEGLTAPAAQAVLRRAGFGPPR
ncbi:MAG: molybdate ABC transporter substrate-binding protein [Solirubrobacteraceae bacterium]|nr:molybdate ABC transporter substrate-binding protein [Solirubrobacteraceae bacterium]